MLYNRKQAKNISTSIPLAIPAVLNVYNTFLLPPPERFPLPFYATPPGLWGDLHPHWATDMKPLTRLKVTANAIKGNRGTTPQNEEFSRG